jgi:TonB family protein
MSSAAAAAAGDPKQPIGKWTVETASNECLLIRAYGSPKKPLFLALSQAPMGGGFQFTVLHESRWMALRSGIAQISFDNEAPIEAVYGARLLRSSSKQIDVETLRSIVIDTEEESERFGRDAGSVSFTIPREFTGTFALPEHGQALVDLNECATALGVRWGYPIAEQRRLAKPAKQPGGLQSLFSADDYPQRAVMLGERGRARIRIKVGDKGETSDCAVLASTGSTDLDRATCEVIRRKAGFSPALDLDGKPIRSVVVTTVYWILM